MTQEKPSNWQQNIEGEWHGVPSVFDAEGNHTGFNKVFRSSVFKDGQTTYYMDTKLDNSGPLRSRFEADTFAFGVRDSDLDRIYLGPDFIGAGHPYGAVFVDAHYYSPAWTSDLRTMVHILPDGETQVYSSLLFDGPTINGVFNGIYKVAYDYESNSATRERIDAFIAEERIKGKQTHVLPAKVAGEWRGELQVYDAEHKHLGKSDVRIAYKPLSLLRAECELELAGVIERRTRFARYRNGHRHSFEGPDLYGNGMGYGRALYTSQHFFGESLKIRGREFLIDDEFSMSVVWQWFASDRPLYTSFGLLRWNPGEEILAPRYED